MFTADVLPSCHLSLFAPLVTSTMSQFCGYFLFSIFICFISTDCFSKADNMNKYFIKTKDLIKSIQMQKKPCVTLYLPLRSINIFSFFSSHTVLDSSDFRNQLFNIVIVISYISENCYVRWNKHTNLKIFHICPTYDLSVYIPKYLWCQILAFS